MAGLEPGPTALFQEIGVILDIETEGKGADEKVTRVEFRDLEVPGESEWNPEEDERDMTEEEANGPGFVGDSITLQGYKLTRTFQAPPGRTPPHFTIRELFDIIAKLSGEDREAEVAERNANGLGLDTHHCFFEGLELQEDGKTYKMAWGS